MPEEEPETTPVTAKPLADTVTAIAGAITAAAALVVIPGGVAMWLRLSHAELPAELGVVSSLPSQFLVAVGGAYILFPLLVVSGLAILVTVVPGDRRAPNPNLLTPGLNEGNVAELPGRLREALRSLQKASVLLFMLIAIAAMLVAVTVPALPGGLLVIAAAVLTALIWRFGVRAVARRHRDAVVSPAALALVATVTTTVFLPWAIAFSVVRGELPPATVCRADGERLDGYLIGETSDRVYMGELPQRIVLFLNQPADATLRGDATGALHNAGYEVKSAASPNAISFGRVGLVVADLADLGGTGEIDRLFHQPETAHVRVIAFSDTEVIPVGVPRNFTPVDRQVVADRTQLVAHVKDELGQVESADRPERRITSVPSSQVSRLLIGSLGPCPPVKTT